MARWLAGQHIALRADVSFYLTAVVTLVTGTMFLMWLGEQITEKGVGNGISLIIFSGIVSNLPNAIASVFQQVREGQMQALSLIVIAAIVALVTGFVVFVERGQRRIRVNYAQRTQGKRVYAAQTSHLPLKINMASVIPPIFASSIILIPATVAQFLLAENTWIGFRMLVWRFLQVSLCILLFMQQLFCFLLFSTRH